ncbi:vesicle transport protein, partial [Cladochytrium replicatum]
FAVLYTFGNIISLVATGFLVGFLTQLKKMFDPTRLVATIIFLAAMVVTFLVAILLGNAILVLVCVLVQYCALFWYSASYIPFARDAMKKVFGGLMR